MTNKKIIKLIGFCVCLLIIRMIHTHHVSFVFLLWNLFLAWLPYYFIKKFNKWQNTYYNLSVIGLCILFLPNAPYIITDLFHLKQELKAPLWFDLILILSFALVGMFFFILTVKELLKLAKTYNPSRVFLSVSKLGIMALSAYGVYLGRYLRFNSWDLVSDPLNLFLQMLRSVFGSGHFKETFSMTATLAIFLFLCYELYETFNSTENQTEKLYEEEN